MVPERMEASNTHSEADARVQIQEIIKEMRVVDDGEVGGTSIDVSVARLDIHAFSQLARQCHLRVRRIAASSWVFRASDFTNQIVRLLNVDEGSQSESLTNTTKAKLDARVSEYFNHCPPLRPLLGAIQLTKVEAVQKERKQRQPKEKQQAVVAQKAKRLTDITEEDQNTKVSRRVKFIYKELRKLAKEKKTNRHSFYHFIVHPTSFSDTVENLFYFSFLLRDGLVALDEETESGLPDLVVTNKKSSNDSQAQTGVTKKQLIDTKREVEREITDGANSCFASLSDRFTRCAINPGPLAEHGLVSALVHQVSVIAAEQPASSSTTQMTPQASAAITSSNPTSDRENSNTSGSINSSVSTVISLLSALDAIVSGCIQLNFMDDAGQTLSNWTSAFGTQEMVDFLWERGADVNKGQRSSSLHCAACFGRSTFAIGLRYVANPDWKNEDGKTPLDEVRKRNDEGHSEAAFLQSPGEWLIPMSPTEPQEESPLQAIAIARRSNRDSLPILTESEAVADPKDEHDMAPVYLRRLLPFFCHTFQTSLIAFVRKASLTIIKKMVHYSQSALLTQKSSTFISTKDLCWTSRTHRNTFAELIPGDQHLLARGRDCLYIWIDAAALKLSNLWFRFILDGKLATMYSSGCPEDGLDSSENWGEYFDKLHCVLTRIRPGTSSQVRFTAIKEPVSSTQQRFTVGNWSLPSVKDRELIIKNSNAQRQAIIPREDFPGFLFESNRGTIHIFTAEMALGSEFADGWASLAGGCGPTGLCGKRSGRVALGSARFRSQAEVRKQKVRAQAQEICQRFLQVALAQPRGVVARLATIAVHIERGCAAHQHRGQCVRRELLRSAVNDFRSLLEEDSTLYAFELQSSGLVHAIRRLLSPAGLDDYLQGDRRGNRLLRQRVASTNRKTVPYWVNPAQVGLVVVISSEVRNLPCRHLEDISICAVASSSELVLESRSTLAALVRAPKLGSTVEEQPPVTDSHTVSTSESIEEKETAEGASPAAILKSFANVARIRHQTGTTASSSRRGGPSTPSGSGSSQASGCCANGSAGGSNTSEMILV